MENALMMMYFLKNDGDVNKIPFVKVKTLRNQVKIFPPPKKIKKKYSIMKKNLKTFQKF